MKTHAAAATAVAFAVLIGLHPAIYGQASTAPAKSPRAGGDARHVVFTLPFEKALARAKAARRLLFIKPIYGGVDAAGARDYRCGSW